MVGDLEDAVRDLVTSVQYDGIPFETTPRTYLGPVHTPVSIVFPATLVSPLLSVSQTSRRRPCQACALPPVRSTVENRRWSHGVEPSGRRPCGPIPSGSWKARLDVAFRSGVIAKPLHLDGTSVSDIHPCLFLPQPSQPCQDPAAAFAANVCLRQSQPQAFLCRQSKAWSRVKTFNVLVRDWGRLVGTDGSQKFHLFTGATLSLN